MEDNLNILENVRKPQFLSNGRQPQFFQMEDYLNFLNGRRPQNSCKAKTTSTKIIQPKTIEIKTMVVAPLRVT